MLPIARWSTTRSRRWRASPPCRKAKSRAVTWWCVAADRSTRALDEILDEARSLGFLGRGPVAPQLRHSRAFASLIEPPPQGFVDLGSGGGLPGLALAVEWPTTAGTLLDSNHRRTQFLTDAVAALGFGDRLRVVTARAEDAARASELRGGFDLVAARSFAAPAVTAECAVGFLQPGGRLVVSEPPDGGGEERWPASGLEQLGLVGPELLSGQGVSVAVLTLREPVDDRWPRRTGIPTKRPLW